MARKIRSSDLETRTARLKLAVRKKPYTVSIARGIRLAYRRNQGGGVWSVLKADGVGGSWLQRFALADDHEDANGSTILDYWQASEAARKLARGDDAVGEVEGGRPATVAEAVAAYQRDLVARGGAEKNANRAPLSPPGARADVEAGLLADRARGARPPRQPARQGVEAFERQPLHDGIQGLPDVGRRGRRADRESESVEDLGAARQPQIHRNVVLTEEGRDATWSRPPTRRAAIASVAYGDMAATGAGQFRRGGSRSRPRSRSSRRRRACRCLLQKKKGRGRKRVERAPVPIPAGLAKRLKALAVGRGDHEPLLVDDNSAAGWKENGHQQALPSGPPPRRVCRRTLRPIACATVSSPAMFVKGIRSAGCRECRSSTAMIEAERTANTSSP